MQEQGIEDVYIEILKYIIYCIYTDSSVTVGIHEQREWENQDQERSRHEDTISPKLFTAIHAPFSDGLPVGLLINKSMAVNLNKYTGY